MTYQPVFLHARECSFIRESNEIENEVGVDLDHLQAFIHIKNRVFQGKSRELNENFILNIHLVLMQNKLRKYVGEYRKSNVQLSTGKQFPSAINVPYLMDEWIKDFNSMKFETFEMHKRFENIHPFIDGNGRTGRLLWAFDMLRLGLDVYPMLDNFDRQVEHRKMREARGDDMSRPYGIHFRDNSFYDKRQRYYESLD